ncbi:hypothetical protein EIP91_008367 [Steccherinum ochraceum]|uniref:Uncharacterized protein n=1 Tax=Steccherinum ochraceum TaxID=92696 RepID=A0A4R0R301_9APHY|nr:hypothetical protein EIP91_008367 [Steccherinum ochraceum]
MELKMTLPEVDREIQYHEEQIAYHTTVMRTATLNVDDPFADPAFTTPDPPSKNVESEQISYHANTLLDLRYQRNSLIPISRLHPDILSQLFLQYRAVANAFALAEGVSHDSAHYRWLPITHVCRRWRRLAVGIPLLWSHIRIGCVSENALDTFLARSQDVPLRVECFYSAPAHTPKMLSELTVIQRHLIRVQSLSLGLPPRAYNAMPPPAAATTALQSLFFDTTIDLLPNPEILEEVPLIKESKLTFPALASLHVSNYRMPWSTVPLPRSLTHLSVSHSVSGVFYYAIPEIISAIRSLPELEDVVLRRILPPGITTSTNDQKPVVLPRLKSLLIQAHPVSNVRFLDCLLLPASASIRLEFESRCPDDENLPLLVRPIISKMTYGLDQNDPKQPVDDVQIRGGLLGFYSTPVPGSTHLPRTDFTIVFFHQLHYEYSDIMGLLIAKLPLHHTSRLLLENAIYPMMMNGGWHEFFDVVAGVERLDAISLSPPQNVLGILHSQHEAYGSRPRYVLPKLHTLTLERMAFRQFYEPKGKDFVWRLRKANFMRAQEGCVLQKLVIRECLNMDQEDVTALKQEGVEVEWDGSVGFDGEDDGLYVSDGDSGSE